MERLLFLAISCFVLKLSHSMAGHISLYDMVELSRTCPNGTWGFKCRFSCNCKNDGACHRYYGYVGKCVDGCKQGFWGSMCQRRDECNYGLPTYYMGAVNKTKSGLTCQRWDKQSPHKHDYHDVERFRDKVLPENYCRVWFRERVKKEWCYTMSEKRWEYCDIQTCECPMGLAGGTCWKECHCKHDAPCPDQLCSTGCALGWTGKTCDKATACPPNRYSWDCANYCMCEDPEHCDRWLGPTSKCKCRQEYMHLLPKCAIEMEAPLVLPKDYKAESSSQVRWYREADVYLRTKFSSSRNNHSWAEVIWYYVRKESELPTKVPIDGSHFILQNDDLIIRQGTEHDLRVYNYICVLMTNPLTKPPEYRYEHFQVKRAGYDIPPSLRFGPNRYCWSNKMTSPRTEAILHHLNWTTVTDLLKCQVKILARRVNEAGSRHHICAFIENLFQKSITAFGELFKPDMTLQVRLDFTDRLFVNWYTADLEGKLPNIRRSLTDTLIQSMFNDADGIYRVNISTTITDCQENCWRYGYQIGRSNCDGKSKEMKNCSVNTRLTQANTTTVTKVVCHGKKNITTRSEMCGMVCRMIDRGLGNFPKQMKMFVIVNYSGNETRSESRVGSGDEVLKMLEFDQFDWTNKIEVRTTVFHRDLHERFFNRDKDKTCAEFESKKLSQTNFETSRDGCTGNLDPKLHKLSVTCPVTPDRCQMVYWMLHQALYWPGHGSVTRLQDRITIDMEILVFNAHGDKLYTMAVPTVTVKNATAAAKIYITYLMETYKPSLVTLMSVIPMNLDPIVPRYVDAVKGRLRDFGVDDDRCLQETTQMYFLPNLRPTEIPVFAASREIRNKNSVGLYEKSYFLDESVDWETRCHLLLTLVVDVMTSSNYSRLDHGAPTLLFHAVDPDDQSVHYLGTELHFGDGTALFHPGKFWDALKSTFYVGLRFYPNPSENLLSTRFHGLRTWG